jgi:hypothetical protein
MRKMVVVVVAQTVYAPVVAAVAGELAVAVAQ